MVGEPASAGELVPNPTTRAEPTAIGEPGATRVELKLSDRVRPRGACVAETACLAQGRVRGPVCLLQRLGKAQSHEMTGLVLDMAHAGERKLLRIVVKCDDPGL